MEAIIGLLELVGGMILFIAVGFLFARISGYGDYYDKMLYDDDSDVKITRTFDDMDNKDNDEDKIHHATIKKKLTQN